MKNYHNMIIILNNQKTEHIKSIQYITDKQINTLQSL